MALVHVALAQVTVAPVQVAVAPVQVAVAPVQVALVHVSFSKKLTSLPCYNTVISHLHVVSSKCLISGIFALWEGM